MYRRVLLKLSGEALAGSQKFGFDEGTCVGVARQAKEIVGSGVELAVVSGGGNFWRGRAGGGIDRARADQIGMLATVMNCIYLSEIFTSEGLETSVYTPFECGSFARLFSKDAALADLKAGKAVFFAGGTGHPYFSTDTSAVLRALEIEADVVLSAKSIDGVYDSDPAANPNAKKYDKIGMDDVINGRLGVIDLAAAVLCMENHMPMLIFGLDGTNSIVDAANGEGGGTLVTA